MSRVAHHNARCPCQLQVLPAVVRAVPADSQAERPADASNSAGEQLTDAGELRQVVEGGNIVYWPGFESVMHYILYNQVTAIRCTTVAVSCAKHDTMHWVNSYQSVEQCCPNMVLHMQLGWQHDEEGSVIMPEPLFTSRVSALRLPGMQLSLHVFCVRKCQYAQTNV